MKSLTRLFILNLVSIFSISTSGQDIYFTISAEYNSTKVSIDSLLFENLSNNSSLLFSNLPDQQEYHINLSKQKIEESTGIRTLKNESSFTMIKCFPGELAISWNGRYHQTASIEIYNIKGQKVYASSLNDFYGGKPIRINHGNSGIYFVQVQSSDEIKTFKAFGSGVSGILEVYIYKKSLNEGILKSISSVIVDEFSVQAGDSLRVLAFKEDLFPTSANLSVGLENPVLFSFSDNPADDTTSLTDIDGNVYNIVHIGEQWWMAEDLRTTHYANGELIPDGTGIGDYRDDPDPDYWFAYNDSVENIPTYGRLYTWYTAADHRNVCPAGWYLPSDADWDTLETYLGGMELAGGKMKEAGTEHWMSPNEGATNESGFTALPGGSRSFAGGFHYLGTDGHWWSSTHADEGHAWYRFTSHFTSSLMRADPDKRYGLSVRCIKDTGYPGTLASLVTLDASSITDTSALISWNVTNDGGSAISETGIYWGTEANPKENGTKLAAGTGSGQSSVSITGLSHSTIYYATAYAVNDEGESIGNEILFLTAILSDTSSVTDIDGNTYRTIKLWDQWWMAENLKVTKYTDGTPIPTETDNTAWGNLTIPGYCWYNNDSAINAESYGALYNWYTVNTGNLCPTGWHVPADSEWTTLIEKLGGEESAGGRLKEAGTVHWISPNTGATNESGFTALPGGYRDYTGIFNGISGRGGWWTASESEYNPLNDARNRTIDYNGVNVRNRSDSKRYGFSVRCVKDSVGSGVKSFLKINNDEQDLEEVAIMYYGNERNKRIHDRSIYIFSSGHNINWETLEGTGSGAIIEFFAYNTRLEIDTGAYQFANPDTMFTHQDCTTDYNGDGLINQDDCFYTLPDGTYFISAGSVYNSNTNINELYDNANYFQSGSMKVTMDGELVSIEFNYQGLNGDEITGNYSGTPRYYNFSSKK